jgi:hypothetical protein
MTDRELMQMALDTIYAQIVGGKEYCTPEAVINALRERLAQPEPEPVQVLEYTENGLKPVGGTEWITSYKVGARVYITPVNNGDWLIKLPEGRMPKREWVGLESEEKIFKEATKQSKGTKQYSFMLGAKWAEAQLKEKND